MAYTLIREGSTTAPISPDEYIGLIADTLPDPTSFKDGSLAKCMDGAVTDATNIFNSEIGYFEYVCFGSLWYPRESVSANSNGDASISTVVKKGETVILADAVSVVGVQNGFATGGVGGSYQASNSASSTGETIVDIEVSNDGIDYFWLGTIPVSGANDTAGFVSIVSWPYSRANIKTYTDGDVTVTAGG